MATDTTFDPAEMRVLKKVLGTMKALVTEYDTKESIIRIAYQEGMDEKQFQKFMKKLDLTVGEEKEVG